MEISFVTSVTGLNRPNTGKEDDDDIFQPCHNISIYVPKSQVPCYFQYRYTLFHIATCFGLYTVLL
jgi:hypothetical protein